MRVPADVDGHPVAVRQCNVVAISFHPELTGERRLHELLLEARRDRRAGDPNGVADGTGG